ncbi:MAG TPA: hypothetical protein VI387_01960 [Candidatus Brocadiales bacterium]|nr:hypothetical protein [Candidatus Brocadiales bacterium]
MSKKVKTAGIFLLTMCLLSLSMAHITEGAPTPDQIIDRLQERLDTILLKAETKQLNLSLDVATQVNKYTHGQISQPTFCSNLDNIQNRTDNAREKFNRKIIKVSQRKIKQLQNVGADSSYITTAEDMRDDAGDEKDALYDTLDTEIANAEQVPSPWCT